MSLWGLAQADCIIVMGSNMAENHPVGFRFVVQAKARGATVIHVDPRFTRTSALADIYAPIRPGTDIAFLGGMIRHILRERSLVPRVGDGLHQHRRDRQRRVSRRGGERAVFRLAGG